MIMHCIACLKYDFKYYSNAKESSFILHDKEFFLNILPRSLSNNLTFDGNDERVRDCFTDSVGC